MHKQKKALFDFVYYIYFNRSLHPKNDKCSSIYQDNEFDMYSNMKCYSGPQIKSENHFTDYDKLSTELWADYFYDLKMQNIKQNDYDYGFSKDFIR